MVKLCDLVEVVENNMECVVLKVKGGVRMQLIFLGCFTGDETMFRLTKGRDHTCTVFPEGSPPYSWHWGPSGNTPVPTSLDKCGRMVEGCISEDFGIYIGADTGKKAAALHIRSLEDAKGRREHYKLTWWENNVDICIRKDGEFLMHITGLEKATAYINEKIDMEYTSDVYKSPDTGCCIMDIKGRRK